jgi:phage/plasmid-like protein (TIGR03299 family)
MEAGLVDVRAALDAAVLNWTVRLERMYLSAESGRGPEVPNRRAVVRDTDGDILGTVSSWYQPIQYADAFGIFQPAVEEFGLTVEAAGALGKGERAWMLFRLPTSVTPVDGDVVNGYGVAVTGHDGKTACEFRPTPIRVVCQNTLDAAIGNGGNKGRVFSISHIGSNVEAQVKEAKTLVRNVINAMQETGETFAAMARRRMTPQEVAAFVETVFPSKADGSVTKEIEARRMTVLELMATGVGADLAKSATDGLPNAWSCYNAVTEYVDHVAPAEKLATVRNQSAIFGSGADLKLLALRQASRMVAA